MQIVNHLHGIYMNVDRRYYIPLHTGKSAINLHPGYQKLDGGTGAFVCPLPTHGQRHLPHRQAAALHRGAQEPAPRADSPTSLSTEVAHAGRRPQAQHRDREGRWEARSTRRAQVVPRPPVPPAARHLFRNAIPLSDFHNFTTSAGAESSRPRRARSPRRCTASSTPMSATHRRSTGSSAATSTPRRSRKCTSSRGRRSRCSSSTRAPSRVRPPKRVPPHEARLHDQDDAVEATRRTRRRCSATRPSITTWRNPTRSRPRRSFGRSSARTPASSR